MVLAASRCLARGTRSDEQGDPGADDDYLVPGWRRKHDAIAAAALVLFARDGCERTSVDAIAAEAGVSKRTVYSHYGDKESLFLLVLRETTAPCGSGSATSWTVTCGTAPGSGRL